MTRKVSFIVAFLGHLWIFYISQPTKINTIDETKWIISTYFQMLMRMIDGKFLLHRSDRWRNDIKWKQKQKQKLLLYRDFHFWYGSLVWKTRSDENSRDKKKYKRCENDCRHNSACQVRWATKQTIPSI